MTTATQYAKALFQSDAPAASKLKNLREALSRRGHEKLLPQIFTEYEKLEEGEKRNKAYRTTTKESERTRVLLELYNKLIQSNG